MVTELNEILTYVKDTTPISNLAPFLVADLSVVLMYLAKSRLGGEHATKDGTRLFVVILIFVAGHVGILLNLDLPSYYLVLLLAALRPLDLLLRLKAVVWKSQEEQTKQNNSKGVGSLNCKEKERRR